MNKNSSTFMKLPLSEGMKETIKNIGFTSPTPIQEKAIPEILAGHDFLGQAQTGTGKTCAFGIPILEKIDDKSQDIQALVVCPTRELCIQVCSEIQKLSFHKENITLVAVYGGQPIEQQLRIIKKDKPQIVIATPGRLFDHLRRNTINLNSVKMIVLDEADEMLDMGFRPEIEEIFELLPEQNQRIFFSATMPKAIEDLAYTYLRSPKIVKSESRNLTAEKINQSYIKSSGREKTKILGRLLDFHDPKLAVVFCNAKSTIDEVVDEINMLGFQAGALHGDLTQAQRDRVMAGFRSGQIRVLVATDIAARGIDINDVELVLNYHLPHDPEDYVHRIGRTGRAGRAGHAISLVEPKDNSKLRKISHFAKINITEKNLPTTAEVKNAKLNSLLGKIKEAITQDDSSLVKEYKSFIAKNELSAEEIAAGLLHLTFEKFDERNKKEIHLQSFDNFDRMDRRDRFKSKRKFFGDHGGGGKRRDSRSDRNSSDRGERRFRSNDANRDRRGKSFSASAKSSGNRQHFA